ncbi:MAG: hypothetical protein ACI88H_001238 [Cocleimonas sp.]|jgi:hypothetical protein
MTKTNKQTKKTPTQLVNVWIKKLKARNDNVQYE